MKKELHISAAITGTGLLTFAFSALTDMATTHSTIGELIYMLVIITVIRRISHIQK